MRIKRLGSWAMFLAARWVVRLVNFDRSRPLGRFFGDWQYFSRFAARRRCLAEMAVVLDRDPADRELACMLRSAYRVNTISSLEVASMVDRKLDAERIFQRCRVDGVEHLAAARTGRGAILLATHACNSFLLLAQLAHAGWPVTIVYRRSPSVPRQLMLDGLAHYGFEGIPANQGFKAYAAMIDALRRDRVVFAMMDDGVLKAETGVVHRFLGKDMPMAGGIVQLARQRRAPIVPISSLDSDPVWHFRIEPPLHLVPGGTFDEDLTTVLAHVERQILERPALWSWPHRRWRKYPLASGDCPQREDPSRRTT